jgi:hypothetical protein
MPKPLSPRAKRLIKAGKILFGDRYQSALARALCMSQTYIVLLTTGERPVTDALEDTLKRTLQAERKRLRNQSAEIAEIINEINDEEKHDA